MWPVNAMVKVFPDDLPSPNAQSELKLYGSRNSTRTTQIVLRSIEDGSAIVEVSDLKGPGGNTLPAPAIFKAGFVPTDHPVRYSRSTGTVSEYHRKTIDMDRRSLAAENSTLLGPGTIPTDILSTDGWSYEYIPDALIPVETGVVFDLKKQSAQPVYIDVEIPADAEPGVYHGELIVTSSQHTVKMPIDGYGPSCEGYNEEDTEEAYGLFIDHITKKGWRKNFVYFACDEPGNITHEADKWEVTTSRANMAKRVAPDVPVYSSCWHIYPVLEDRINLWGIGSDGSFQDYKMDELRKKGDRFWFTTDGQMTISTPYLAMEIWRSALGKKKADQHAQAPAQRRWVLILSGR